MLKKLLSFIIVGAMSYTSLAFAQQKTVTGTVVANNGEPLTGVTIRVLGTSTGTVSDLNGHYSISVSEGSTLSFSFIGYKTEEEIVGTENVINVVLEEDLALLDELVVTALGVRVNERAVTFATQQVDARELNLTQDVNIKTSLAGKVAGVQIVGQAGSKLGDFGDIRIRGAISITGALSEPLYVVDGVPISDPNSIDMNNVEDLSVLKGPNATALYGQRGENGAVLITTKGANRTGVSVEFTNSVTWDEVAYLPKFQNLYGQGDDGDNEWNTFSWDASYPSYFQELDGVRYNSNSIEDASWGPKFDGQPYAPWYSWFPDSPYYGQTFPWEAKENNIKDFYDTGVQAKTGLAVNVRRNNYSARVAYTNFNQKGLLPDSDLNKHYLSGKFDYDVNSRLKVGAIVNYTLQKVDGDVLSDDYGNSTSGSFNSWFARDADMNKLRELQGLKTPDGYFTGWNWWGPDSYRSGTLNNGYKKVAFWFNPYTWMDQYDIIRNTNDLMLNFDFSYQINNQFELTGSANTSNRNYVREFYVPFEIEFSAAPELYNPFVNSFGILREDTRENNYASNLNYKTNFNDWNIDAFVGGNIRMNSFRRFAADMSQTNWRNGGLLIPDLYQYSNSAERITPESNGWNKHVYSLYAKASVGYKDYLYLDGSYRQDWSSALPAGNNGYGYPGIGVSFVFSELMENNPLLLSYGKLRAGWAQVGNDVAAERIFNSYPLSSNPYSNPVTGEDIPLIFTNTTLIDPNIKPALNSSFESGVDLRFIEDRVGLSLTYFNDIRKNEIIGVSLSATNGNTSFLTNAGTSHRTGWELTLNGSPVKTKDFLWNVTANWSATNTVVTELPEGLDIYEIPRQNDAFGFVFVTHKKGEKWGQLRGSGYALDDNGNRIIASDGTYEVEQNKYFGSVLPDWTGGILNTFSYKNFQLMASIDFQKGGKFFSLSEMWGTYSGLFKETADLNDKGNPKRDPVANGGGVHVTGVDGAGNAVDTYVDAYDYYHQWYSSSLAEPFIHDASFIKLRELNLTYTLPASFLDGLGNVIKSASVGAVARNLWMIAVSGDNKHKWDPSEMSRVFGENGQMPGIRSYGFNINVNF